MTGSSWIRRTSTPNSRGHRRQRVGDVPGNLAEVDGGVGPQMLLLLDPRQRQQIVDETRHPPTLLAHDAEKLLLRAKVVLRRALQRFDEAEQRGQRRAQLVAGVGDEVGAHPLDLARLGEIAQRHERSRPSRPSSVAIGLTETSNSALDRHAFAPLSGLRFAGRRHAADRVVNVRRAQRQYERFAEPKPRQQFERGRIGVEPRALRRRPATQVRASPRRACRRRESGSRPEDRFGSNLWRSPVLSSKPGGDRPHALRQSSSLKSVVDIASRSERQRRIASLAPSKASASTKGIR